MAAGRPRAFDKDKALERAMHVFWQKGYEGASLTDLTRAMGINPPSLYAAFGNKESLFRQAVDRYEAGPASRSAKALAQPTARRAAEALMNAAADLQVAKGRPRGCLVVQGALACGDDADPLRIELAARRAANVEMFRARLERAQAEGDLPKDADPAALARFVASIIYGMAVQATGGATRAELQKIIDTAMRAWPS
ncbi:MAG: TetR/AcrR family transcriptional regulator [Candidatus Eiseniibacteriota bacterium]